MYSAFGIKKIGSHCITRYTAVDALRRFVFVCFVYTFPKKEKRKSILSSLRNVVGIGGKNRYPRIGSIEERLLGHRRF